MFLLSKGLLGLLGLVLQLPRDKRQDFHFVSLRWELEEQIGTNKFDNKRIGLHHYCSYVDGTFYSVKG